MAEALRSRHIASITKTWSMDKVTVAVVIAVGAILIAIVYRYTFGYGLLL